MKKIYLVLLFSVLAVCVKAQSNDTTKHTSADTTKTYYRVEVEPAYPGGVQELFMYLAKNQKAGSNEGMVRVSFTVEKDGSISDIKVEKSLSESADKEAVRLVSKMPKWSPGMQGGRPVRVRYSVPVKFPMK
ncbi:MAG TPA: energy transducer TonB [Mucilaginibacter sp.]|nr:energy transducer TonB [Mucilaginibacter sp.]